MHRVENTFLNITSLKQFLILLRRLEISISPPGTSFIFNVKSEMELLLYLEIPGASLLPAMRTG